MSVTEKEIEELTGLLKSSLYSSDFSGLGEDFMQSYWSVEGQSVHTSVADNLASACRKLDNAPHMGEVALAALNKFIEDKTDYWTAKECLDFLYQIQPESEATKDIFYKILSNESNDKFDSGLTFATVRLMEDFDNLQHTRSVEIKFNQEIWEDIFRKINPEYLERIHGYCKSYRTFFPSSDNQFTDEQLKKLDDIVVERIGKPYEPKFTDIVKDLFGIEDKEPKSKHRYR